jgi:hypothetical protein
MKFPELNFQFSDENIAWGKWIVFKMKLDSSAKLAKNSYDVDSGNVN